MTEQDILDLGFVKNEITSSDTESIFRYIIERKDLGTPLFFPSHIYDLYWDLGTGFTIYGTFERPNNEGVKKRYTKTIQCTLSTKDQLEEKMEIVIKSDTNNYSSAMTK